VTVAAVVENYRSRIPTSNRCTQIGEQPFFSWLLLAGTRHVVNRAATALRLAATTLLRSQSYLGAQYRRLRGRLGAPKAITAMAHKLARLVYRMLRWGHEYVDKGLQYYEERHRQQQVQLLKTRAAKLGLQIIEQTA
jgi:transposase